jgi:DnaK suppressor protein
MNLLADPPTQERRTISTHRLLRQQKRLLRVRAALLQRIKRLTQDAAEESPGYSIHMADAATDSFDRDLTLGLASFEQEALYEVDAALQRIADGTYGVCELTGRRIPWERLEAIPWTRFSFAAEAELETGIHPHIGLLRSVQPVGQESVEASSDQDIETLSEGSETSDRRSTDDNLG